MKRQLKVIEAMSFVHNPTKYTEQEKKYRSEGIDAVGPTHRVTFPAD
jgi:hypothetical protein